MRNENEGDILRLMNHFLLVPPLPVCACDSGASEIVDLEAILGELSGVNGKMWLRQ